MAGKPKTMSQIKQLLRLHDQGKSTKFIARSLGISKNTVKVYLEKIALSKLDIDSLLKTDDPVLERKFHAGNPAYRDKRFDHFKSKLDYCTKELKKTGVTKQLLWSKYKSDYPQGYSLSQFYFHLSQQLVRPFFVPSLTYKSGWILSSNSIFVVSVVKKRWKPDGKRDCRKKFTTGESPEKTPGGIIYQSAISRFQPEPGTRRPLEPKNRIGETGLFPVSSFHTTVRTIRYIAVPCFTSLMDGRCFQLSSRLTSLLFIVGFRPIVQ